MKSTSHKKTVLITGASSGIGLSISRAFAKAGYSLALTGLEASGHDLVRGLHADYGVKAIFKQIDLKNSFDIHSFAKEVATQIGTISVIVNNAGIQHVEDFGNFQPERWDDVISVNLSAVFHMTQAVWQGMKEQGFGRIINISSVHGMRASEHKAAYVAAKHGVVGLTKVLSIEGAPHGISANAVCPGWVATPLVERQIEEKITQSGSSRDQVLGESFLKRQAVKDFVPAELIADTCLFLASEGSRLLTGTVIPIDGAWTAQ